MTRIDRQELSQLKEHVLKLTVRCNELTAEVKNAHEKHDRLRASVAELIELTVQNSNAISQHDLQVMLNENNKVVALDQYFKNRRGNNNE